MILISDISYFAPMEFQLVYITCKDREEARLVGRRLVESRLAACANIIDGMTSLYWWEGRITEDSETVLIAKTRAELVEALISSVKSCHSYEVPCVVALPILAGNPDYLQWLAEETQES